MKTIGKKRAMTLVEKGAKLVDMRTPVHFRDSHIEGAVNLPLRNFVNTAMGWKRDTKIVLYGVTSTDSDLQQASNYAEQMGFTEIYATDFTTLSKEDTNNEGSSPTNK